MIARALLATLACVLGWACSLAMLRYANPMFSVKTLLHLVAASAPVLSVVVAHAPAPVAIIASALLQLIALYSTPPTKAKGAESGFARFELAAFVSALALGSLVGCAVFRSAAKDPAHDVAIAKADAAKADAIVSKACAMYACAVASHAIKPSKAADDACAADAALH